MSMNGIDISNYQSTLDLAKVPCDFVIAKATQGTSYVNPSCDKHVQQALKLDKPFGVYHYISGVGATAEADYFIDNCKNYVGTASCVLIGKATKTTNGATNPILTR